MMHQAKKTGTLLLPPLFLLLFLLATDPYKLPLVLIVIPFLLVGLTVFLIVKSILGISPLPETKVRLGVPVASSIVDPRFLDSSSIACWLDPIFAPYRCLVIPVYEGFYLVYYAA